MRSNIEHYKFGTKLSKAAFDSDTVKFFLNNVSKLRNGTEANIEELAGARRCSVAPESTSTPYPSEIISVVSKASPGSKKRAQNSSHLVMASTKKGEHLVRKWGLDDKLLAVSKNAAKFSTTHAMELFVKIPSIKLEKPCTKREKTGTNKRRAKNSL